MVEEAPVSEASVTMGASKLDETLKSNEAAVESNAQGGTESTCDNINHNSNSNNGAETSALTYDEGEDKALELADELMAKGAKAMKDNDYTEAADCFSRALEIRVAQYGELAPECVKFYYKYGCALLYKAQEEADPLGVVPKKGGESQQDIDKDGSVKSACNGESSAASASSNTEHVTSANHEEGVADDVSSKKEEKEDSDGSDADDLADADEDESDLDLAWKMLDVARAIVEKQSSDTLEKVDILSALAEVALEREDIETSRSDYEKALLMLERLVEPDSRQLAELNFRLCLCLEFGSKPQEAVPHCEKAISICKSRVARLMNEVKSASELTTASSASNLNQRFQKSSEGSQIDNPIEHKQAEIETLTGLMGELERKLEDLQQLALNPKSILAEILGIASAKTRDGEKSAPPTVISSSRMGTANSNGGFDSPTVSTAHTNSAAGVTHLGVVGRGVKRVLVNSESADSSPSKKQASDQSQDKGGSS